MKLNYPVKEILTIDQLEQLEQVERKIIADSLNSDDLRREINKLNFINVNVEYMPGEIPELSVSSL